MASTIHPFWFRKFISDFFIDLSHTFPNRQLHFYEIEEYFAAQPEFESRWQKFNNYSGEPGMFKMRLIAMCKALTFINASVSNDPQTINNIANKPEVILAACVLHVNAEGGFDLKRFVDYVNDFREFIAGSF